MHKYFFSTHNLYENEVEDEIVNVTHFYYYSCSTGIMLVRRSNDLRRIPRKHFWCEAI